MGRDSKDKEEVKEGKEESGFGFKDKEKALETLRLLESHEPQYRRLTVRGLLGRAKRVLSLTKAEDKIKNIKEAMTVFEEWLAELDKDKNKEKNNKKSEQKEKSKKEDSSSDSDDVEMEDKAEKKEKSPPPDKVPGLGFKDPEAARGTILALEGRDPDYQKLAVKGLLGSAKRVLTGTKDETKLKNIKEAMAILDQYLDDFDSQHRSRENNPYLPLAVVESCYRLAVSKEVDVTKQSRFVEAYRGVKGDYKRLRTVKGDGDVTWDIVRNKALKELKEKYKEKKLFDSEGQPTSAHLELIAWGYSGEASRLKKLSLEELSLEEGKGKGEGEREGRKRRSSARDSASPSKKNKE